MPFLIIKVLRLIQNKNSNNTQTIKNIDTIDLAVNEVMINIPAKFRSKIKFDKKIYMKEITVSVIIPSFNRAHLLPTVIPHIISIMFLKLL